MAIHDFDSDKPRVTYTHDGEAHEIRCDFIAGCDGYHGVSRASVPPAALSIYEKVYPFGWLGVLADTPPVVARADLLQPRARLRAVLDALADAQPLLRAVLAEGQGRGLERRRASGTNCAAACDREAAEALVTGPSIEKSIAPLRSFVAEPMRFGRLFLAGDAAHIVPPTGAKGLNLAASDVRYLSRALIEHYKERSERRHRPLFAALPGARLEGRALFLVVHRPDAQVPRDRRRSARSCSAPSSTTWSARAPPRRRWPRTTSGCRSTTEARARPAPRSAGAGRSPRPGSA